MQRDVREAQESEPARGRTPADRSEGSFTEYELYFCHSPINSCSSVTIDFNNERLKLRAAVLFRMQIQGCFIGLFGRVSNTNKLTLFYLSLKINPCFGNWVEFGKTWPFRPQGQGLAHVNLAECFVMCNTCPLEVAAVGSKRCYSFGSPLTLSAYYKLVLVSIFFYLYSYVSNTRVCVLW